MNPTSDLADQQADTCIAMLAAPLTLQQSMYRMLPAVLLPPALFKKKNLRALFRPLINAAFKIPYVKNLIAHTFGFVVILRSEEHTSELQSRPHLVCRLLLEKKK